MMICIAFDGCSKQLRGLHMTNSGFAISDVLLVVAMYSTAFCRFYDYLDMYEMFSSHLEWPRKNYVDFACFDFGLSA